MTPAASLLLKIYTRALQSSHPAALMASGVHLRGETLEIGPHRLPGRRVWLAGVGKAALAMAQGLEPILGSSLCGGLLVVPESPLRGDGGASLRAPQGGQWESPLRGDGGASLRAPQGGIQLVEGSHPMPDERSLRAAVAMRSFLESVPRDQTLLFLLSGGASSLMELPRPGISLPQLVELYRALLLCGAPIQDINAMRRSVSLVKGGGLLPYLPPQTLTLIVSDVLDESLEVVGSGPTMLPTPRAAGELMQRYGILSALSWDPRAFFVPPPEGEGRPHYLLSDVHTLLAAAVAAAPTLGLTARALPELIRGDARRAGQELARCAAGQSGPGLWVAGGEATVAVPLSSRGRGGRCQELALGFAREATGRDWTLLAAGSDGRDGNSPAAGAWVDGTTWERARQSGFDPEQSLTGHDAFPCLKALDQIIAAYPTGNNLNDLVLLLTR